MTLSYVRRYPGGMRGLGQDVGYTVPDSTGYTPPDVIGYSTYTPPSSTLAQIFGPLSKAGASIAQQYMAYQNPLYSKQTVALTPQGQVVYATNQPTSGAGIFGAAGAPGAAGSLLPILLIGGLGLLMVAGKR